MFIPIRTDVTIRRTPWMNWALIVANTLVHVAHVSRPALFDSFHLDPREPQILNFFTYQFLHVDLGHLFGNMLFLYIFGNNVNEKLGHVGYLAFYLAGGVMSGISHMLASSHPVVGASGAISAVTGAYMVLFPASNVTILYFIFLVGTFELSGLWFVLLFFLMDIIRPFGMLGGSDAVAHMAHVGGTVFGVAISLMLLWTRLLPRDVFDLLSMVDRWNRRRKYREMVASGFDPFGYPAGRRAAPDPNADRIQDLRGQIYEAMSRSDWTEAVKHFMTLRALDPQQTLSKQQQLDLANHLFETQQHAAAADAYENYLRMYPKADRIEHVQLVLGLLYARYLSRDDKAKQYFELAMPRLHNEREVELARTELSRIASIGNVRPA